MRRPQSRRILRLALSVSLLCTTGFALALDTATITASVLSPQCLAYRVVGVCYWLLCTPFGCSIRDLGKGEAQCARRSGLELSKHGDEPLGRGIGNECAEPLCSGRWRWDDQPQQ